MKHTELRIGNYISDGTFLFKVLSIYQHGKVEGLVINSDGNIYSSNIYNVSESTGILLTEEWLLKFGFKKNNYGYVLDDPKEIKKDYYIRLFLKEKKDAFYLKIGYTGEFVGYYNYVHQLQNLYFALTGEELSVL